MSLAFSHTTKTATIDPKNAAIGYSHIFYSCIYKRGFHCATIAPYGFYSRVVLNAATGTPIAVFFYPL